MSCLLRYYALTLLETQLMCVSVRPNLRLSSFTSLSVGINGRVYERNQAKLRLCGTWH